ncbi:MAG TPA: vanadium-dependent haloperoxidase [Acidobacteriota bacterium]|nr:vanadium-dependent haloperoxidase [Acidobacteriota bacterium]
MRIIYFRFTLIFVLLLIAPAAWGASNSADNFSSDVASVWFDTLYDVIKSEGITPPPAARIYGVTSIALYESVVSGTLNNESLVGQLNGLNSLPGVKRKKKYHWPTAANSALAETIRGIFTTLKPENAAKIDAIERQFNRQYRQATKKNEFKKAVEHGKRVAEGILAWASTDGYDTLNNCPYVPAQVPGAWKPTPPANNPNPLQPCWGQLRPMVLTSLSTCAPPVHPEFNTDPSSDFYAAAFQVYDVGINLTDEQKTIARYWADGPVATGTPAGHWIALIGQFARNDLLSLPAAAEAYARVGIAVNDAFIQCWNDKYQYNLQRPITYIQEQINANWTSFIVTPSFPSYSSGHSTQSGAAAFVMTDQFGIREFTDTTHVDHGLNPPMDPRTFNSIDEAAAEAALSRLYGGIHYSFDNNNGFASGQCIGETIVENVHFHRE